MLISSPAWTIDRPADPELWPGGVQLYERYVVGEWYCLDRTDGSTVWEQPSLPAVNYIAGIHDGILLCVRLKPGRRPGRGACALRLADGQILWSSHLTPISLDGSQFLCIDGTVCDLRSGAVCKKVSPPKTLACWGRYEDSFSWSAGASDPGQPGDVSPCDVTVIDESLFGGNMRGVGKDGVVLWRFSPTENGWFCGKPRHAGHARQPYIYWVATKELPYRQVTEKMIEYIPCTNYLLTLDARTGRLAQEIDLGVWSGPADFGGVDERGAVICFERTHIVYFAASE